MYSCNWKCNFSLKWYKKEKNSFPITRHEIFKNFKNYKNNNKGCKIKYDFHRTYSSHGSHEAESIDHSTVRDTEQNTKDALQACIAVYMTALCEPHSHFLTSM